MNSMKAFIVCALLVLCLHGALATTATVANNESLGLEEFIGEKRQLAAPSTMQTRRTTPTKCSNLNPMMTRFNRLAPGDIFVKPKDFNPAFVKGSMTTNGPWGDGSWSDATAAVNCRYPDTARTAEPTTITQAAGGNMQAGTIKSKLDCKQNTRKEVRDKKTANTGDADALKLALATFPNAMPAPFTATTTRDQIKEWYQGDDMDPLSYNVRDANGLLSSEKGIFSGTTTAPDAAQIDEGTTKYAFCSSDYFWQEGTCCTGEGMMRMKQQFAADVDTLKAAAKSRKTRFEEKQTWLANNLQAVTDLMADMATVLESTQRLFTRFLVKAKKTWGTEVNTGTTTATITTNSFNLLTKTAIKSLNLGKIAVILAKLGYTEYTKWPVVPAGTPLDMPNADNSRVLPIDSQRRLSEGFLQGSDERELAVATCSTEFTNLQATTNPLRIMDKTVANAPVPLTCDKFVNYIVSWKNLLRFPTNNIDFVTGLTLTGMSNTGVAATADVTAGRIGTDGLPIPGVLIAPARTTYSSTDQLITSGGDEAWYYKVKKREMALGAQKMLNLMFDTAVADQADVTAGIATTIGQKNIRRSNVWCMEGSTATSGGGDCGAEINFAQRRVEWKKKFRDMFKTSTTVDFKKSGLTTATGTVYGWFDMLEKSKVTAFAAQRKCYTVLLEMSAATGCLACDPNWKDKMREVTAEEKVLNTDFASAGINVGAIKKKATYELNYSFDAARKIQAACYPMLKSMQVMGNNYFYMSVLQQMLGDPFAKATSSPPASGNAQALTSQQSLYLKYKSVYRDLRGIFEEFVQSDMMAVGIDKLIDNVYKKITTNASWLTNMSTTLPNQMKANSNAATDGLITPFDAHELAVQMPPRKFCTGRKPFTEKQIKEYKDQLALENGANARQSGMSGADLGKNWLDTYVSCEALVTDPTVASSTTTTAGFTYSANDFKNRNNQVVPAFLKPRDQRLMSAAGIAAPATKLSGLQMFRPYEYKKTTTTGSSPNEVFTFTATNTPWSAFADMWKEIVISGGDDLVFMDNKNEDSKGAYMVNNYARFDIMREAKQFAFYFLKGLDMYRSTWCSMKKLDGIAAATTAAATAALTDSGVTTKVTSAFSSICTPPKLKWSTQTATTPLPLVGPMVNKKAADTTGAIWDEGSFFYSATTSWEQKPKFFGATWTQAENGNRRRALEDSLEALSGMPGQEVMRTLLTEGLEHENRRMLAPTFQLTADTDKKAGTHTELMGTAYGVEGPSLGNSDWTATTGPNRAGGNNARDPWGSRSWTPTTSSAYLDKAKAKGGANLNMGNINDDATGGQFFPASDNPTVTGSGETTDFKKQMASFVKQNAQSKLFNDPTLWLATTTGVAANTNTDDERAYSPGLGASALNKGQRQFDLGTGKARTKLVSTTATALSGMTNPNIRKDYSPTTGPFSAAVKTALLTTPLDAEIGSAKFDSTSGTGDAAAIALKAKFTTATTNILDNSASTYLTDAGPIGGTVYYACDVNLGDQTTPPAAVEKLAEVTEKLNNLKSCEASGGTNTNPTTPTTKSDDDDSSLTWLWWVLGVLGFLIIAAAVYYFAVVRRKRIMEAEARHHTEHHVPTHHDVHHRDVHVVSHH